MSTIKKGMVFKKLLIYVDKRSDIKETIKVDEDVAMLRILESLVKFPTLKISSKVLVF